MQLQGTIVFPLDSTILVRSTAWVSFLCYMLTLIGCLTLKPGIRKQQLLRLVYTFGCAVFLIHVALAFHYVHAWSHQAAWEATALQGGYGDGIYLNYLMMAVWLMDVIGWWIKPDRYTQRSAWMIIPLHCFMLFMWFNATVVFAHDYLFIVGTTVFLILYWAVLQYWRKHRKSAS
jgi:positive regulator of sigma E activity